MFVRLSFLVLLLCYFYGPQTAVARDVATYEEVKNVPKHPEKYLIDVRNPEELKETGKIPASINIPLLELEHALGVTSEEFKQKYGRDKPTKEAPIIFTCKIGKRAQEAVEIAKKAGYVNTKPYIGSWTEWAEMEKL